MKILMLSDCLLMQVRGLLVLVATMMTTGCGITSLVLGSGNHPVVMTSPQDIHSAPAETDRIRTPFLPLLVKFRHLKDVDFYTSDGTGGTDAKLAALASIGFTELFDVTLLNCPFGDGYRYSTLVKDLLA